MASICSAFFFGKAFAAPVQDSVVTALFTVLDFGATFSIAYVRKITLSTQLHMISATSLSS